MTDTDFRAEGEKLHTEQPELMLSQVYRFSSQFSHRDAQELVEGYKAARARRDAFLAEQKETPACTHTEMVPNDDPQHAWKCAVCGYVYS